MALGIDQRMRKAFTIFDANMANRSSVDGLSIGGSAISDQGVSRLAGAEVGDPANVTRGASIDIDQTQRAGERFPSDMSATRSANVDMDQRRGERLAGDTTSSSTSSNADLAQRAGERAVGEASFATNANSDQAQRAGERIAGESSFATNANVDQAQRAGERIAGESSFATNANVDQAQRAGERIGGDATGGVAQHEPGSFGDPIKPVIDVDTDTAARSVVHDIAPTDLRGGFVDEDTVRSAVRDATDADLRGGLADVDLGGTAATTGADGVRGVRDVTDVDLRGTAATSFTSDPGMIPNADSAEAYEPTFHSGGTQGDAFLTSDEASQYSAGSADASGTASDEGQLYNPAADATTAIPEHHGGDAIGNTTTGHTTTGDPEISA